MLTTGTKRTVVSEDILLDHCTDFEMSSFFKRTRRIRSRSTTSSKHGSVESVGRSSSNSDDGRLSLTESTPIEEDPRMQKFLYKLREAYTWRERYGSLSEELQESVTELLDHSMRLQSQFAYEGQYDEADRVAKNINEIQHFWGKPLLQQLHLRQFNREIMNMSPLRITASQYFEPEVAFKDSTKLKIFSFAVTESSTGNMGFKYYLVYNREEADCYMLELMTSKGVYPVRIYGVISPTFWSVRQDVLYDISGRTGGYLGGNLIARLPTKV